MNWQDFIPIIAAGITIVVFLWKFPTKSDMNRRFAELRSEFREDIKNVREEIKDVREDVRDVREEIRDVRGELKDLRVAFMNYILHRNTEEKD